MEKWNDKVYFDTGMFYAYVLNTLTQLPTEEMPF